jgi:hypothetical protein
MRALFVEDFLGHANARAVHEDAQAPALARGCVNRLLHGVAAGDVRFDELRAFA